MLISELQDILEEMKVVNGDVGVVVNDADTNWIFPLTRDHLTFNEEDGRLEIGVEYTDDYIIE